MMLGRLLMVFTLLLACDSTNAEPDAAVVPASGLLTLSRQVSWPGGGSELTVQLVDEQGAPLMKNWEDAFEVLLDGSGTEEFGIQVRQEPVDVGFTALLVRPADTESERLLQVDALKRFVNQRPADEAIGVFLWLDEVTQLSNFTSGRSRLEHQIDRLVGILPAQTLLAQEQAISAGVQPVALIGGQAPRGMRSLVVVGSASTTAESWPVSVVFGLQQASERIDALASSSFYRISICAAEIGASGQVRVQGMDGSLSIVLRPTLPETKSAACDVAAIGAGKRAYPEQIEFVFDSAQREVYDNRVSARSKEDFDLSVRFGSSETTVATAHLRGQGTISCERKSYSLSLDGPGRHLLPDSLADKFYLVSMCLDDRYVQQHTANQIMAELGLFSLKFRYIELLIDGETRGVYLLLEKPREELIRDNTGVQAVMRRNFNGDDSLESTYDSEKYDAIGIYDDATTTLEGLAEHIDLEQYLRHLALMTAYRNGDYVDEVWVRASEQGLGSGQLGLWFEFMAWDNDDLFSACHSGGSNAYSDPNGLAYCAEASLDWLLLGDAEMYARYVDVLEELLLNLVPPERFDAAANATEQAIMPLLSRLGVSAAMVQLDDDPVQAKQDVTASLAELRGAYRSRHALLLQRISAYRDAQ